MLGEAGGLQCDELGEMKVVVGVRHEVELVGGLQCDGPGEMKVQAAVVGCAVVVGRLLCCASVSLAALWRGSSLSQNPGAGPPQRKTGRVPGEKSAPSLVDCVGLKTFWVNPSNPMRVKSKYARENKSNALLQAVQLGMKHRIIETIC